MKELSNEIITKRIKEAIEQYEPDYSPHFWEKIRKQRPVPKLRLKTLLLKYKFWLSILTIIVGLFIVYKFTNVLLADKNSAVDPVSFEFANYIVLEKTEDLTYSKKTAILNHSISNIDIDREEENMSSEITSVQETDFLQANYQEYAQIENTIAEMPDDIENNSVIPVLLEGIDFDYQYDIPQLNNITPLIPIEYRTEDIQLQKGQAHDNTSKLKFNWPNFNNLLTKNGSYDKFIGPNKLAFFYSPEIHSSDSLKTFGVSQGVGISFEGPVRSLISISVGLSYQEINFHKTIFSEKVRPHLVLQPGDTNRLIYRYSDSVGVRSGSYKFLELPVAVNYKFIESPRSQVWLGAGFSSVAFLRQDYTYETIVEEISQSSSTSVKAWKNIHPLASLNFSLLYRYNLSSRFLLHGSAQYKHHLVPVGYNSMKLNRLNLQVGLIYCFGRQD